MEARYWQAHAITPHQGAVGRVFLSSLRSALPGQVGPLAGLSTRAGLASISRHYGVARATESPDLLAFLADDVDHVRLGLPSSGREPSEFYRGNDVGWGPIESGLDVRRALTDNVVADAVLAEEPERRSTADLFVIKGPAGNGKSVSLKRGRVGCCYGVRQAGLVSPRWRSV